MVEKDESDSLTTEATDAITSMQIQATNKQTGILREAIAAMETILSKRGVRLMMPSYKTTSDESQEFIDLKLSCVPAVIESAILSAMVNRKASNLLATHPYDVVGEETTAGAGVVQGNIVALYAKTHGKFLRIMGKSADYGGGEIEPQHLPLKWGSERYLVVDAGKGLVSFFNPCQRRFLAVDEGWLVSGLRVTSIKDRPRGGESFKVVERKEDGSIALFCPTEGIFLTYEGEPLAFKVIQVKGFVPAQSLLKSDPEAL